MKYQHLSDAIIKTLCYFDIFEYPLRPEEVYFNLPHKDVPFEDVHETLKQLNSEGVLRMSTEYYYLTRHSENIVTRRLEMEKRAKRMQRSARWMAKLFKKFPFVRCVLLTGDLSKNVAGHESDIDFLIITEADRLWVCRTVLMIFRRIFFLNNRKWMCINYFLAKGALEVNPKNIYTAVETATAQVLWNEIEFKNYCDANRWIYQFLPNWRYRESGTPILPQSRSILQRIIEGAMRTLPLDRMDQWLMSFSQGYWSRKYNDLDEDRRAVRFSCSRQKSTAFGKDHHSRILDEYDRRVRELRALAS